MNKDQLKLLSWLTRYKLLASEYKNRLVAKNVPIRAKLLANLNAIVVATEMEE